MYTESRKSGSIAFRLKEFLENQVDHGRVWSKYLFFGCLICINVVEKRLMGLV